LGRIRHLHFLSPLFIPLHPLLLKNPVHDYDCLNKYKDAIEAPTDTIKKLAEIKQTKRSLEPLFSLKILEDPLRPKLQHQGFRLF
jgi:hypothetical protein